MRESGVERPAELPRARQQVTALPGFRVQQGSQEIVDRAQNLIRVFNATRRLREPNVLPEGEATGNEQDDNRDQEVHRQRWDSFWAGSAGDVRVMCPWPSWRWQAARYES